GHRRRLYFAAMGVDSFGVSPDGSQIVLTVPTSGGGADLWIVDRYGRDARQIVNCGSQYCGQPVWSPDGAEIAFERRIPTNSFEESSSRIWLYHVDENSAVPLFEDESHFGFGVTWSRDSRKIAYYDPDTHLITTVTLDSGQQVTLPSEIGQTGEFSP